MSKPPLRAGTAILNRTEIEVEGTIACLMHTKNSAKTHYALTAAHVYKDLDKQISVGKPAQAFPTKLQAHPAFNTVGGAEGDIGLLIVDQAYPRLCGIKNLDTRAANTDPKQGDQYDPFSIDEEDLEALANKKSQEVRKFGAMSGDTAATLTGYLEDGVTLKVGTSEPKLFTHVLEATWKGSTKFAEPGDSGCLWYLQKGTAIVPIGVHLASVEGTGGGPRKSYATMLTHCADRISANLKVDVVFCSAASCGEDKVAPLVFNN